MAMGQMAIQRPSSPPVAVEKKAEPQTRVSYNQFTAIPTKEIYKSVIPNFLYKPPYGYPRNTDIVNIRRLADTPFVEQCIRTIVEEITCMKWDIVSKDENTHDSKNIEKVKRFFLNPNNDQETFENILRKAIRDIITIEAGCWVKIFDNDSNLCEIRAVDGATVLKNPDIFGSYAGKNDIIPFAWGQLFFNNFDDKNNNDIKTINDKTAYYQYGWGASVRPMPFGKREIILFESNPRTSAIYPKSAMEIVLDAVQMLVYGIDFNLEYFIENNVPKGVFSIPGASTSDIDAFKNQMFQANKIKDSVGNWRKNWHYVPTVNQELKFTQFQLTNEQLQLIACQQWFTKLVWSVFGVTPSELGITEDSNRATEIVQSKVFRRKTIRPLVSLIETMINNNLISEFETGVWVKNEDDSEQELVKGITDVKFKFDMHDIQEDLERHQLFEIQLRNGIRTKNEIREEMGLEPIEGGDELGSRNPFDSPFKENSENVDKEDKENEKNFKEKQGVGEEVKARVPTKYPSGNKIRSSTRKKLAKYMRNAGLNVRLKDEEEDYEDEDITNIIEVKSEEQTNESKVLEEEFSKILSSLEMDINSFITSNSGTNTEIKSIPIVEYIKSKIDLSGIFDLFRKALEKSFNKGLENTEIKTGMNFMNPDKKALDFLITHGLENVKDMGEELKNDIRAELERGMLAGEGVNKLKERIKNIFSTTDARAQAIARTETNRANNFGKLDGYRQSGLMGELEWVAKLDDRTSILCRNLNGQRVRVGEQFKASDGKKEWTGYIPPAHVNCRSTVVFHPDR